MQSSANVKLSPEEEVTVSVAAKDLCDFKERGLCMMGMPGVAVCDGEEPIPLVSIEELNPCLF